MKRNLIFILVTALCSSLFAQDSMEQVMEKRGRELVRVIGINDKDSWRTFIKENYTQELIDKQMRAKIESSDGESTKTETTPAHNLEGKVAIYERLHNDIGKGKILSLKRTDNKLDIEVKGESGATITFALTFLKATPFLIDGFSVQVTMEGD